MADQHKFDNCMVFFSMVGCKPCQRLKPELEQFQDEVATRKHWFPKDVVRHFEYDRHDRDPERKQRMETLMKQLGVTSFPTMLMFVHGKPHRPTFFGSAEFRKWPSLMFAALVVYLIGLRASHIKPAHRRQIYNYFRPIVQEQGRRLTLPELSNSMADPRKYDAQDMYYVAHIDELRDEVQQALAAHFAPEQQSSEMYPNFDELMNYALAHERQPKA